MDDPADTRLPRLAPLLLIGVLAWLAVSAGEAAPGFHRVTTMVAVAVVGDATWRFHGLVAAADRAGKETEASRFSNEQSEFLGRNVCLRSFLHSKGSHTKRSLPG